MFPHGPPHARSLVRKLGLHKFPLRTTRRNASSSSSSSSSSSGPPVHSARAFLNAAITSGACTLTSDILVQLLEQYKRVSKGGPGSEAMKHDFFRTARMLGYGFVFYGPVSHYWYNLLDRTWNRKTYFPHFISKVAMNQFVLGPIVLLSVFSWNLGFQGKMHELGEKMKKDFMPSLQNGWKFWIPAASVNFYLIPVQRQVLYMSLCSIGWTGYLSYASNSEAGSQTAEKKEKSKS